MTGHKGSQRAFILTKGGIQGYEMSRGMRGFVGVDLIVRVGTWSDNIVVVGLDSARLSSYPGPLQTQLHILVCFLVLRSSTCV